MSDSGEIKPVVDFASLLANFVHQVINPLNGVSGTLDNLVDGSIPREKTAQRLRAARAQLEQSILLIRNLAFFSELSAAKSPDLIPSGRLRKPCVIPQIIIEAVQFFQELGLSKGIKIHLQDRETQYKVEGNPDLLRQVFMNICDNGVKYGKKNSPILIESWIQKTTGALLVRITGRSIYIPPDERHKIFELGYRSSEARKKLASGTGLGLYICSMILRVIHNATIEVETSTTSDEVAFLIRFPIVLSVGD